MTNPSTPSETKSDFQKLERFNALSAGQFWKAKFSRENRIDEGEILLISKVDDVEGSPHTIHVRLHPSKQSSCTEVKFLFEDFLSKFEFIDKDEAERSRAEEIREIQGILKDSQDEMTSAFTNPAMLDNLVDKEMPLDVAKGDAKLPVKLETVGADIVGAVKTQNLTSLMAKGLTETGIEQIRSGLDEQKDIAVRRSEWIQMRTKRLSAISAKMTPFFEEKAALALAMTQDMRDHVDDLMKGIGNLNLYVLKDVEISTLRKGVSAPPSEKLSIAQRVLFMDEEVAVWANLDDNFDCQNREVFFEKLSTSNELRNQIFPTTRSIVSIATTRHNKGYMDRGYSVYEASALNKENARQFLLVRDGDNIHVVESPDFFHQFSASLFPSLDSLENIFKGFDGRTITYNDLDYTRRLSKHEKVELGYKRMLILLCGLDHNKQLFGDFYKGEATLEFVSQKFQEENFNFIHDYDGQGMLPSYRPKSFKDWVSELNKEVKSGSKLLIQWRNVLNIKNAPSLFEKPSRFNGYGEESRMQYYPLEEGDSFVKEGAILLNVYQSKGKLFAKIDAKGETRDWKARVFKATVDVSDMLCNARSFDCICLDRFNAEDADWYLHDRPSRNFNVSGINLIKAAISEYKKITEKETGLRSALKEAVLSSGQFNESAELERLMDKAIATVRCAYPNKDLNTIVDIKKDFNSLCDQVFYLGGKGRDVTKEIMAEELKLGQKTLRITLRHDGKHVAYSLANEKDRDDRLVPFSWVKKTFYRILKNGVKSGTSSFVFLSLFDNTETTLFEENESVLSEHVDKAPIFKSPSEKIKYIEQAKARQDTLSSLQEMKGDKKKIGKFIDEYEKLRDDINTESKASHVIEPFVSHTLGMASVGTDVYNLGLSAKASVVILWLIQDDPAMIADFRDIYTDWYSQKEAALVGLNKMLDEVKGKSLPQIMDSMLFNDKASNTMFSTEGFVAKDLRKPRGYSYSLAKAIESIDGRVDLFGKDLKNLDDDLGFKKPKDWALIVVKKSGFSVSEEEVAVFEGESARKLLELHHLTVKESWAEFYSQFKTKSVMVINGGDSMSESDQKVYELDYQKDKTVEYKGVSSSKVFVYKIKN